MTDRELMQQALDALEGYARNCRCEGGGAPCDAAEALRARLAQPQREWQGLTDEEMREAAQIMDAEPLAEGWKELIKFASAIEAKLREKNNG